MRPRDAVTSRSAKQPSSCLHLPPLFPAEAPAAGVGGTAGSPLSSGGPSPAKTEKTTRSRSSSTGSQPFGRGFAEGGAETGQGDPKTQESETPGPL